MNVPVTDPGLPDDDPRQLIFKLLKATGLSVALAAPRAIEYVLSEAVHRAPVLVNSSHVGRGIMALNSDPDTLWLALESRTGSAVVICCAPTSNIELIFPRIVKPFEAAAAPFKTAFVALGEADASVVSLLDGSDIVPLSEFPPFNDGRIPSGAGGMPITGRRAARNWRRTNVDLYVKSFTEPAELNVMFTPAATGFELTTVVGRDQTPAWVAPLLAAGDHIESFDPEVALVRPVPAVHSDAHLDTVAQRFVNDVWAAWEASRAQAASVPTDRSDRNIWDRIEAIPRGAAPGRPWHGPTHPPAVVYIERVRHNRMSDRPEGVSAFDEANTISHWLTQSRGSGAEYAWRDDADTLLSPPWLSLRTALIDRTTGRVVAAGHLKHQQWGLEPAYDMGAIDGRNGMTFPREGHGEGMLWPSESLYVGSLHNGSLVPLDATLNVCAVDYDRMTGAIAVFHHLGSSIGGLTLVSPTGNQRFLTTIEGISAGEPVRFSPDGSWILISRSSDSVLIEAATGQWLVIDVGNAVWWPGEASILLSIRHQDGRVFPALFDLAANRFTHRFPDISLNVPLLEPFPYVWGPDVSPDGTEVVAHSPAGLSTDYQQEHGAGNHLVRFTLATGQGVLVSSPFLDADRTLERDAREARWVGGPADTVTVRLHSDLHAQLQAPVTEHEWAAPGRWGSDTERALVRTVNTAIERMNQDQPISHLMPEILAYLVPVASDPEVWLQRSEWLTGLRDAAVNMTANGTMTGDLAASWRVYSSAIGAIEAGRPELIDPLDAAWIR